MRVPLIFWPATALGKLQGQQRAATVDVLPTVLEIMGIAERPAELDGRSLCEDGDWPFIGELVIEERSVVRTVINGRWKYIAAQKWLPPAARPSAARVENDLRKHGGDRSVDRCGPTVHDELYDLATDPREQRDVLAATPGPLELLRAQLAPVLAACRAWSAPSGESGTGPSEADLKRLRALGYVE